MDRTEGPVARPVAMIGLDAADLDFIRANISSLPHLRRALETGITRPLHSTAGALTGSVWPTFFTERPPGDHGIYHHLQWDSSQMQLRRVTEEWLYCEPFWYELARRGLRVIAIDVPMTFQSRLTNGVEVTTWGSHDELTPFSTHPAELRRSILKRFGRHPMGHEIPVRHSHGELEKIRRNLIQGARLKAELGEWLSAQPWDFFLIIFGECHRGGHILWPGNAQVPAAALLDVYGAVDEAVGRLLKSFAERAATVYLFALHGMGANTSQEHFAPRIVDLVNRRFTNGNNGAAARPRKNSPVPWLREHVPAGLQNTIARSVPVAVRDAVVNRSIVDGHDWSRTPGFAVLADANAYLRFNLEGREQAGMLKPGSDKQMRYRDLLLRCLRSFRLESGQPLVQELLVAEEDFPGSRSQHLPDIIVTWPEAPPAKVIHSEEFGTIRAELATGRGGNHRPNGFCIELQPGRQQPGTAEAVPIWELGRLVKRELAA
jgi:predicted AlkP superfamily phosphohydrolase/phosphomutase